MELLSYDATELRGFGIEIRQEGFNIAKCKWPYFDEILGQYLIMRTNYFILIPMSSFLCLLCSSPSANSRPRPTISPTIREWNDGFTKE
jgi:hypothetical protein